MFTGIVQACGIVLASTETPAGKRLTLSLAELVEITKTSPVQGGDSICVSGVCLTVVQNVNNALQFDVITETLNRSTLGTKRVHDRVNLELSLRGDSFVGGHFVQGHVDAIAKVTHVQADPLDWRITFSLPADVMVYMVPKGSVAVDGVSMTIAEVAGNTFTLAVIPTTLERTTLGSLKVGDPINVETDILARTVVNYLKTVGDKYLAPGSAGGFGMSGGLGKP
ncbi:MAG: riboflavin synthase [Phycisphaerales bacterium]|nr:riboflavin synthase [Phycisphaerales bacterium]